MVIFNLLKTTIRNYFRNSLTTGLNFIGLSIGMIAFYVIGQYVYGELSYEKHIKDVSAKYRVTLTSDGGVGSNTQFATNYLPLSQYIRDQIPEVSLVTTFYMLDRHAVITHEKVPYKIDRIAMSDGHVFEYFDLEIISGRSVNPLEMPGRISISKNTALQIFGDSNPIGQRIYLDNEDGRYALEIESIFRDPDRNTHFRPNVLVSVPSLKPMYAENEWRWNFFATYVQLKGNTDPDNLEVKFTELLKQYKSESNISQIESLSLQPISEIHLGSNLEYEFSANGNLVVIQLIGAVGLCILLLAIINYANLSSAIAMNRIKELSIRKTLGSSQSHIHLQFFIESSIVILSSMVVGVTFLQISTPVMNELLTLNLSFDQIYNLEFWVFNLLLFICCSIFAGLYPAILSTSINPLDGLKGKLVSTHNLISPRKILVMIQFTATVVTLTFAFAASKQYGYLMNADPGYEQDQVLILNGPRVDQDNNANSSIFLSSLDEIPTIQVASQSSSLPGIWTGTVQSIKTQGDKNHVGPFSIYSVDENYHDVFNIKIKEGSDFDSEVVDVSTSVIINEFAAKLLGFESSTEAINNTILLRNRPYKIVGVHKDYHHFSYRQKLSPIVLSYRNDDPEYFSILLNDVTDVQQTISSIQDKWDEVYPADPFDFYFQNSFFEAQYLQERQTYRIFVIFAIVAVVISCMGLFGSTVFYMLKRRKEIGIRKVLGASVNDLILTFSSTTLILICLSVLFSVLIANYLLNSWLENFVLHIELTPVLFVAPIILIIATALISVFGVLNKALNTNPVEILRDE